MPGAIAGLRHHRDACLAMLDWLTGNCQLFGLEAQNWMLVIGGGLLLYIATLVIARQRQARMRKRGTAL
jgi:hypothetical protein